MTAAAHLYGSYDNWPDSTITFGGGISGAEVITATLTGLYVDHVTGALSARTQMVLAMTSAGATAPFFRLLENGFWEIGHTGADFTLTWTDTLVRDFWGFSQGNLSGSDSYVAASKSPYNWSPGRPESPRMAPLGVIGQETADVMATAAPGGRVTVSKRAQSDFVNQFDFSHIPRERYQTDDENGLNGEYKLFHSTVLQKGWKFFLHRNVNEDDLSSTPVSFTLGNGLGPLILNPFKRGFETMPFRREFVSVEKSYKLAMHVAKSVEYEA